MPQPPDWKRVLETGMNFTELRRSQAYRLATELVAQGQLARDQIGAAVDELVEMSRRRSEELRAIVAAEVQRQLTALGLATHRDLGALERRLSGKGPVAKTATKPAGAKKAPAKKTPAKKTPAKGATKAPTKKATKKAAAGKAPAKTAAKKTAAKKAAAKKTAAKRSVAKRSTAKRATVKRARRPAAGRAR